MHKVLDPCIVRKLRGLLDRKSQYYTSKKDKSDRDKFVGLYEVKRYLIKLKIENPSQEPKNIR